MSKQSPFITLRDVPLACGLLSRLPIPVDTEFAASRGAGAAWAYPLAGGLVALIAGGTGALALMAGLPAAVAAGLVLAMQVILTGAMHEDGLADTADGLWGGWTKERRLEIMKDSRIGTYGVLALVLSLLLRWSALTTLGPALLPVLLAAALLSRAVMVGLMTELPNAREGGLSSSIGRPGRQTAWFGSGIALGLSLVIVGSAALPFALAAGSAGLGCAAIARAKIGGQTGDILGASQQICEIAILAMATAMI